MNKNNQKLKEWEKHEPLDFNTVPLAESREILISILPPLERITKDAEAKRLLGDAHIVQVSDESVRENRAV